MNKIGRPIVLFSILLLASVVLTVGIMHASTPNRFVSNEEAGIVVSTANNGFLVSNIPQIYQFNFTLNGSVFKPYISYINPNTAGFALNGSIYALNPGETVKIRNTSGYSFYVQLANVSYYSKPPTVNVYVYSVMHYSSLNSSANTTTSIASTTITILTSTVKPTSTVPPTVEPANTIEQELEQEEGPIAIIIVVILAIALVAYYLTRKPARQDKAAKK